jgi:Zn-dependent M28 family amino/carboxypeptidase
MNRLVPFVAVLTICGCSRGEDTASATTEASARVESAITRMPAFDAAPMLEHIKVLSSDEFEGRGPGSKGEELTATYLEEQFKKLGLQPGNPDGTYVQGLPLVGITATNTRPLTIAGASRKATFKWSDDVVAWTKRVTDTASIADSDLVFVGYGVTAPEYEWDDFKDLDVRGKTLIVLVNDPQVPDAADPSKLDSQLFNGVAMTYYGRWTYKFEEAARRGAAGALIVHETGPAGYPFSVVQGNLSERFDLVTPDKNMGRSAIEGWLSLDAARAILQMAGQDLDVLKKQALTRDFRPVALNLKASLALRNRLRTVQSRNFVARLEGADPQLRDEYVIYTAHWDHLGIGMPVNGDAIYNGALDNASGVATVLEIARAFTQVEPRAKRSILFLMVGAEEQGLLGSELYAKQPLYPLAGTLANINIDGVNQWGRTRDITVIGMGASDLDDYLRDAAATQGRMLRPDPESEKGFYYRSDHFNFAKQGVPALYTDTGVEFVGKPPEYSQQKRDEYTNRDYHAPSDGIKPDWDLAGAAEDAQLLFLVGYNVANAERYPEWKPGNEFRATREKMLGQ